MITIWQDVHYGFRILTKNPVFTVVVVLTLAIAIGATTAMYSVVHATILDPLPVQDPDRLFYVQTYGSYMPHQDKLELLANPETVAELRAHPELFETIAVYSSTTMKYHGDIFPEEITGYRVSRDFLSLWGAHPALGRFIRRQDTESGAEPTIVLSHRFWSRKFGADRDIIGRSIEFGDGSNESPVQSFRVVGVMPPHFRYPGDSTQYWIAAEDPTGQNYRERNYWVTFRLADGVSAERVQALLDVIHARQIQADPQTNKGWTLRLKRITDLLVDEKVHRSLWTLSAVVGLVWLIACANVANLLIARAEGRRHELAVRGALGAERWRLLRLLLAESLLLALLGALCGLVITGWGLHVMDAYLSGTRFRPFTLSWSVFGMSIVVALITGIAFGLIPAWYASRPLLNEMLKQTGAVTTQGVSGRWLTRGLVITEVALAFILLMGAGLMIQSVVRLLRVNVGYPTERLVRVNISPPRWSHGDESEKRLAELTTRLHESFISLPDIESVGVAVSGRGWSEHFPLDDNQRRFDVVAEGCGLDDENPFPVIGAPLIRGRFLNETDRMQNTVVVNETLVRTFWPDGDALGKTFRKMQRGKGPGQVWQVVGVVGDIKTRAFDEQVKPTYYRPSRDYYIRGMYPIFFIRSAVDSAPLMRQFLITVRDVEPEIENTNVIQVDKEFYTKTESRRRFTLYLSLLTSVGVALAAMGIYGLLAHVVVRRTREMGIRMALGATHDAIGWLLIREGAKLALVGVIFGIAGALVGSRLIRSQLFAVEPHDPVTLFFASVGLLLLALVASAIPARRAANIDPMEALRYE